MTEREKALFLKAGEIVEKESKALKNVSFAERLESCQSVFPPVLYRSEGKETGS